MNNVFKKQKAVAFHSKADTKELRDYQRIASQYPPLSHDEIIHLSKIFQRGRDAEIASEEYKIINCVLEGDWTEENALEQKDKVLKAYSIQINWLSTSEDPMESFYKLLNIELGDIVAIYENMDKDIFESAPWLGSLFIKDIVGRYAEMDLQEFYKHKSGVLESISLFLKDKIPEHIPKDVIDQWKRRKRELNKHYLTSIKTLENTDFHSYQYNTMVKQSQEALSKIVSHNLQLAMSRVGKMMENNQRAKAIGVFELIGAANVGLVLGARQFDPHKGRKFSTYAAFHIDGQLYELLNREDGRSGIKGMSLHEQKQLNAILAVKKIFQNIYKRQPTMTELQSLTGISRDIIQKRLSTPQVKTQNIYAPVSKKQDSEHTTVLADTIVSDNDIESVVSKDSYLDMIETLRNEISRLDELDKTIILGKMGLSNDYTEPKRPKTSRKIAAEMNISPNVVNERYNWIIDHLRAKLELHGWSKDMLEMYL